MYKLHNVLSCLFVPWKGMNFFMNEIINTIAMAINALNNIEVKGKQNCVNLCGVIDILENVLKSLTTTTPEENAESEPISFS